MVGQDFTRIRRHILKAQGLMAPWLLQKRLVAIHRSNETVHNAFQLRQVPGLGVPPTQGRSEHNRDWTMTCHFFSQFPSRRETHGCI